MAALIAAGDHSLEKMSRDNLKESLRRLVDGHMYRGQGSGPATVNAVGCVIPKKTTQSRGYVQIDVINEPTYGKAQLAHRIVAFLHSSADQVELLLRGRDSVGQGYQASHLCGIANCIKAEHMVVEPKDANEARKECHQHVVVRTDIDSTTYILAPNHTCSHQPQCIWQIEDREAMLSADQDWDV